MSSGATIIQTALVTDFSHDSYGVAFEPLVTHTDFLHGNLIFVGCSSFYQVVDFGWTPQHANVPSIGTSARFNLAIGCSPPYSFIDFGPTPQGTAKTPVTRIIDTHDGVKKKKKKKNVDLIAEEVERREKLRKQIEEVIHPTVIEVVPVEELESVQEVRPVEVKTLPTPAVDYAGLARQQIIAKIQDDAQKELQRQIELKRLEDEEEERELMMILDDIL